MQEQLRALIEKHCATLAEEARAVGACLERRDGPNAPLAEVVAEAVRLVHKIKGSSGSIGFKEVSAVAQSLERLLRSIDGAGTTPGVADLEPAMALYERMLALIGSWKMARMN